MSVPLLDPLESATAYVGGSGIYDAQAALEEALAACLGALCDLARGVGHAAPAVRLGAATQALAPVEAQFATPGPPAGGWHAVASLTAREREVAGLVAGGYSNRDIAGRLVLSERTVDTHVQRILRKLRLRSRTHVSAVLTARVAPTPLRPSLGRGKDTSWRTPSR